MRQQHLYAKVTNLNHIASDGAITEPTRSRLSRFGDHIATILLRVVGASVVVYACLGAWSLRGSLAARLQLDPANFLVNVWIVTVCTVASEVMMRTCYKGKNNRQLLSSITSLLLFSGVIAAGAASVALRIPHDRQPQFIGNSIWQLVIYTAIFGTGMLASDLLPRFGAREK